jgi:hypothetical protein
MTVFIAAVVHGSIIAKKGRLAQRLRQAGPGAGAAPSGTSLAGSGTAKRSLCAENLTRR